MKPRLIFSPDYAFDDGGHVFTTRKFQLAAEAFSPDAELIAPPEPSREDLLRAHDADWLDRFSQGRLSLKELTLLELPWSSALARAHLLAAGGTCLAARHALETGVGLHCGGGSHHAFRGRGEGYCAINDLAVAALKVLAEGLARRVAVVDLDVHQGNGTASILSGEPRAFTFSLHQGDLYPSWKERSSLDMELFSGARDAEYLDVLARGLDAVLAFKPDLILYQSGVDVWEKDKLGGLKLTEQGILVRDKNVFDAFRSQGVPVAVTLGGGYGPTPEDTARLHAATLRLFAGINTLLGPP
ncbi:MAG: histone deacetylase [Elusimicrobia bacterium]|nr:histone deacetylase [Elusimicrobiota bacterium]